ncbi:MAG TPA: MFS transporter, partial [Myxococcaceae bacterium]|nr:MFS transporter [Myxococcaceae bacterium]
PSAEGQAAKGSMWRQTAYGWTFIRERPGLWGLLMLTAITNLVMALVTVLITPLVLSFADMSALGMVVSISGLGMLLGGIFMSVWGGPKRRMSGVLGVAFLAGAVLLLAGLPPSIPLVAFAASAYLFTIPLMMSSINTIWQSKVAPDLQGRIFAVRRMVALSASPVASLIAGPLADGFFEPWLAPDGALAGSVGRLIGTGTGRGIGFLFVVLGILSMLVPVVAWLSPRVRLVEDELPDVLPTTRPSSPAQAPAPAVEAETEGTALLPTGSGDPSP